MKILVGCEESQVVTIELRKLGHEAFSCDLLDCSGGHPEWHIKRDIRTVLDGSFIAFGQFWTQAGTVEAPISQWDMMIAFPPCTFLTVTGNKWMKPEFKERFPTRQQDRKDAINFFMELINANISKIAVENPVGIMSTIYQKPNQYVHPYHFGDFHSKKTCLWLKGLPKLKYTNVVEPIMYTYKNGRKDPIWHVETMKLPPAERSKARSKTFPGIAKAMAEQFTQPLKQQKLKL